MTYEEWLKLPPGDPRRVGALLDTKKKLDLLKWQPAEDYSLQPLLAAYAGRLFGAAIGERVRAWHLYHAHAEEPYMAPGWHLFESYGLHHRGPYPSESAACRALKRACLGELDGCGVRVWFPRKGKDGDGEWGRPSDLIPPEPFGEIRGEISYESALQAYDRSQAAAARQPRP